MECVFIEYQGGEYGCGVVGKVVNVTADESVMKDDKVDVESLSAIAFDPYTQVIIKLARESGTHFLTG